mmetsp:Transcript_23645/g.50065  ORF Transcript_23645/g.50065 Transcript_23645/m.50065 type:complete len:333 (-) Transcript_23645:465-1463(-)
MTRIRSSSSRRPSWHLRCCWFEPFRTVSVSFSLRRSCRSWWTPQSGNWTVRPPAWAASSLRSRPWTRDSAGGAAAAAPSAAARDIDRELSKDPARVPAPIGMHDPAQKEEEDHFSADGHCNTPHMHGKDGPDEGAEDEDDVLRDMERSNAVVVAAAVLAVPAVPADPAAEDVGDVPHADDEDIPQEEEVGRKVDVGDDNCVGTCHTDAADDIPVSKDRRDDLAAAVTSVAAAEAVSLPQSSSSQQWQQWRQRTIWKKLQLVSNDDEEEDGLSLSLLMVVVDVVVVVVRCCCCCYSWRGRMLWMLLLALLLPLLLVDAIVASDLVSHHYHSPQ